MSASRKPPDTAPCYDDIIRLPHPDSPTHPRMSVHNRAAQFAPFAALTGHDAAIRETARLTGSRVELDESEQAALDRRLQRLRSRLSERPVIQITCFRPDERKAGGAYHTTTGTVKKFDTDAGILVLQDGTRLPIADILRVEGPLFRDEDDPI